ncbi:hypothetical protein GGI04_002310 [Coemansia thaxteri]|uniref:Myb-like domain-containing protein n=1 Tax=Coemansia thaxteri TaxID=2663907 RepID=A0A9W8BHE4_9FUNG|nr:hypothetical protein GGI04_002310 [Coemansia thaxteri]KAJ2005340.1 hypothetical protein H4R26_002006 [Coemansia thaxteri]KAJ2485521.1 hypothetical protein EV174_001679 [Coemansia sp. RSA 2320]
MSTVRSSKRLRVPGLAKSATRKNQAEEEPHPWSQKQKRILFNNVYDEYLDKQSASSIDWHKVSARVRVGADACKAQFYAVQHDLRDRSQPRMPSWTRDQIERVVNGAHEIEIQALRKENVQREIDWGKVASSYAPGRLPQECKRIYDTYHYLCRTTLGISSLNPHLLGLLGVAGLVFVYGFYQPLAGMFF